MKILINDLRENKERLLKIFINGGYEENNLIFIESFQECKIFFENQLINNQIPLDLIITNNIVDGYNPLNASSLILYKNSINNSHSYGNFRISSIPIILYSSSDEKSNLKEFGFNAIVKKKDSFKDEYFIRIVDEQIKKFRHKVILDFENLGLNIYSFPYFKNKIAKKVYENNHARNYEKTFFHNTNVLSKEFIVNPKFLNYNWLHQSNNRLEAIIESFGKMFRYHIKYDRKNNERTIIHQFLNDNKIILQRDSYSNHLYELQLLEDNNEKQICDFILQTDLPDYQNTTFFEVKKEDVPLMVDKFNKRPRFSAEMNKNLDQMDDYLQYSKNKKYSEELEYKLGYKTTNFSYQMLAGSLDEKEQVKEVFEEKLKRRYIGIEVLTFEDYENLNYKYLDKSIRLMP